MSPTLAMVTFGLKVKSPLAPTATTWTLEDADADADAAVLEAAFVALVLWAEARVKMELSRSPIMARAA
jgi:hypothetical protein